jgi:pyruvate/2-oxoacid:ferredoxin oxidoreductase alpha subunit
MNDKGYKLVQGNEACVEGALAAGMRFYAGYPITPSTEIAEICSQKLPKLGGKFIQMEDELASMAAIIGASLAGVKSMTATSGPGFSLMQENIGYAAIAEIPCVIVNVQRGGPSTGLPTSPAQGDVMQARWGTHGDHPAIALTPNSVQETFEYTVKAFNLAEKYRTPVILLMDETVGHMRENYEYIQSLLENTVNKSLSTAAMETLSIIAYKQPVTKVEIERIRGVKCSQVVKGLLDKGLIKETGRLDKPGRPVVYSTTDEFLRHFGLTSIDELPAIEDEKDDKETELQSTV